MLYIKSLIEMYISMKDISKSIEVSFLCFKIKSVKPHYYPSIGREVELKNLR